MKDDEAPVDDVDEEKTQGKSVNLLSGYADVFIANGDVKDLADLNVAPWRWPGYRY